MAIPSQSARCCIIVDDADTDTDTDMRLSRTPMAICVWVGGATINPQTAHQPTLTYSLLLRAMLNSWLQK
jgi:hypothetical protein